MNLLLAQLSVPALLITTTLVFLCFYLWTSTKWHYWKVRGVPYLKPVLPIFGNMYDIIFLRSLVDVSNRIYSETKEFSYVGIYAFRTPVLYVRDPDVISNMLVKHFNHFVDRGFSVNPSDSLGRNLIHQSGADWKFSRTKLAPCFNIAKVKSMLPTMIEKSEAVVELLAKQHENNKTVDTLDTSLRYSTDLVTVCTIGVDPNSLTNVREQFKEAGNHLLGVYFIYHIFTGCFLPKLHRFLGTSVAKAGVTKFFHRAINQIIDYNKRNSLENKDFLHTLLRLKEESAGIDKNIPEIDDNFVVAQSFIFFLAGFETPGNVLACTLFEIAKHQPIQEALFSEINNVLRKHNGQVTFEALQDMKYMKQVLSEALRKYTPLTLIFRQCTKDYVIPGTSTLIEKGTLILIPLRSIHMDPEYYPDPEVFDPERFSDENCATRHIATFMPFGIGPRFCPAVSYSYTIMTTALVHILHQFEVHLTENTPSKLHPSAVHFLFVPKDGVPLTFHRRQT